jgi:hypothetical protein
MQNGKLLRTKDTGSYMKGIKILRLYGRKSNAALRDAESHDCEL